MPLVANELSAVEVRRLADKTGRHAVGGIPGLYLYVKPPSPAYWVYRVKVGMKRRDIGLGGFPEVTLAQARERARQDKELIRAGVDPVLDRKAKKQALIASQAPVVIDGATFDWCSEQLLRKVSKELRNPRSVTEWEATWKTYATPVIGNRDVASITVHDVLKVLTPHWETKTVTMKRLRGRIEQTLAWAKVHGYRDGDNPASWKNNLDTALPAPAKFHKVVSFAAIPVDEAPMVYGDLCKLDTMAAKALRFLILTAARAGEVQKATWSEMDLEEAVWTRPAAHMKNGIEHRVPLTDEAVQILRSLPRDGDQVFRSIRGGKMHDKTLSGVHKELGRTETIHGWRSVFTDFSREGTNTPTEVHDMCLSHKQGTAVQQAYARSELINLRRSHMELWQGFLRGETGGT